MSNVASHMFFCTTKSLILEIIADSFKSLNFVPGGGVVRASRRQNRPAKYLEKHPIVETPHPEDV